MPSIKFISSILPLLMCLVLSGCSHSIHEVNSENKFTASKVMTLVQVLKDNEAGVDGLDNPRSVRVSPDGTHVAVVSGDDNSLAIFDISDDFNLSFNRVFKNNTPGITGLEGASQVAFLPDGNSLFVASFYDSALVVLDRDEANRYNFRRSVSDGLSVERIFNSAEPVGALDTIGLLGAWDLVVSDDGQQIYVTGYKSNGLSVFDVPELDVANPDVSGLDASNSDSSADRPVPSLVKGDEVGLGGAVGLALSADNSLLAVTGFDEHMLTLYNRTPDGELRLSQTLIGGESGIHHLINPQVVRFSPDGDHIYVACAGSNAVVIFNRIETEAGDREYTLFQTIIDEDVDGGLKGVGSLAVSADGNKLFVAAEADSGVLVFKKEDDGRLLLESKLINSEADGAPTDMTAAGRNGLEGVSSLYLSKDDSYLLVTSAKHDSLSVLKLHHDRRD
ncbi:beta-propeller fold lactonase family protein [uncultured Shewanella sp.]|uniref:beta-propeller fold lactonase family protein n=1 Tax=Shewanella atlantica TaxID=271099 RepID=UPI0026377CCC|nr:beta-propeller fold lactonase family protein [uncultured Shewanella sp.]